MTLLESATVYPDGSVYGHYRVNGRKITVEYNNHHVPPLERAIPSEINALFKSVG